MARGGPLSHGAVPRGRWPGELPRGPSSLCRYWVCPTPGRKACSSGQAHSPLEGAAPSPPPPRALQRPRAAERPLEMALLGRQVCGQPSRGPPPGPCAWAECWPGRGPCQSHHKWVCGQSCHQTRCPAEAFRQQLTASQTRAPRPSWQLALNCSLSRKTFTPHLHPTASWLHRKHTSSKVPWHTGLPAADV